MYIIIIQARMGSTRLPGKVLKKLLDKEIVLWSYDRCKKSKANEVIIATSIEKNNDILEELLISHNNICTIDYLPNSIKRLNCSFNKIKNIDIILTTKLNYFKSIINEWNIYIDNIKKIYNLDIQNFNESIYNLIKI